MTATAPLYATCPHCHARVLEVRWDWYWDTLLGKPRLDPVALNHQQITACIITGIPVWQLHRSHVHGWFTSHRTRWWPTRPIRGHVAPVHTCGRTWDAFPVDLALYDTTYPNQPPF